jgi:hypothetical protein
MTTNVWQFNVQIDKTQIQGACNNCSTTIKDDLIPYISSMDNPHACWRRLQELFETHNTTWSLLFIIILLSIRMEERFVVFEFLRKIK